MEQRYGIYFPGLKDHKLVPDVVQRYAVQQLGQHGLDLSYFTSRWAGDESFAVKERRAEEDVIRLYETHGKLVGDAASMGATLLCRVAAQHPEMFSHLVLRAPKLHNPDNLPAQDYKANVAIRDALASVPKSLATLAITHTEQTLVLYSKHDRRVPPADSRLDFGQEIALSAPGHGLVIVKSLVSYGSQISQFVQTT